MSFTEEPAVFRDEPLLAIVEYVLGRLQAGDASVEIEVIDPDVGRGRYAGESVVVEGVAWRHRSLRVWVDLAGRLGLRLGTPRVVEAPRVRLRFERLVDEADEAVERTEKYGAGSSFARICKLEDPDFVIDMCDAIDRVKLGPDARVLELGVNRGDALALLTARVPGLADRGTLVGVDHCASALAVARGRFPGENARFLEGDLGRLEALGPGRFDLVLAIDTLQSSGLDDRALLRYVVQACLAPGGAVILGMPNCRYVGGEAVHGARMRNFRQPELGLLFKDVAFYRKYLQQHGRTVYVTGKYEILLTAVPIRGGGE